MRIVLVAQEMPYPPVHGGSADIWRRLCALRELGQDVFLITWAYTGSGREIVPAHVERLAAETRQLRIFPVHRTFAGFASRLPHLLHLPSYAAARVLSKPVYGALREQVRTFDPDAVLLDGLLACPVAERLSADLGRPLLYRAHNREYAYLRGQRRIARSTRQRIGLTAATLHLRRTEKRIHRRARWVLDISIDDIAWWESRGFTNNLWLPPLLDPERWRNPSDIPGDDRGDYDIGYLGNLRTHNNVEGICWFIREVLPRLAARRPGIRVLIGGSDPVSEILDLAKRSPAVTLMPNVPSPRDVLDRARVLVNPVFLSSGVNIKMIDMLGIGAPIVTTSAGAVGLTADVRRLFAIADDAEAFAAACSALIDAPHDRAERAGAADHWFGVAALARALDGVLE